MLRIYSLFYITLCNTELAKSTIQNRVQTSKRNIPYDNVYKSSNLLWTVKQPSAVACIASCADHNYCWSVAFNKNDRRCQAFNKDLTNQLVTGISESGWTHYEVYQGNICKTGIIATTARDCSEVQSQGHNCSGVYTISPSIDIKKDVWCDLYTYGGRWTVFQQRRDGSVDFDRSWLHYENGFGDPNTEYWIGNEALHHLTLAGGNELLILMQTWDGVWKYAHYTDFYIGPKNDNYTLYLSEYSGTAGDSLLSNGQAEQQFSTKDVDNDFWSSRCNPTYHKGGFWFKYCCSADLNGLYYSSGVVASDSCHWITFKVTVCKTVTPITKAKNCSEVQSQGHSCSGVYTIHPSVNIQKDVWCDLHTLEGRWTVFQRRKDGSVDFYRRWSDYEHGFGDPTTEYWIGNEALYHLTLSRGNELLILMQSWDGVWKYAHYTDFYIGSKNDNYRLHLSEYSGSAGNSLLRQVGYKFSTFGTDNDVWSGSCNPQYHKGGFWFSDCGGSDLNGYYYSSGINSDDSCHWWKFAGSRESLKTIYMMVR